MQVLKNGIHVSKFSITILELSDPKYKKDWVIAQKKALRPRDIFIGYPSVFQRFYSHLQTISFSEEPDYGYLKQITKEALIGNFPEDPFTFEPFRSRQAKSDYLKNKLKIDKVNGDYEEEASWDKSGYWVDSFTNFKVISLISCLFMNIKDYK